MQSKGNSSGSTLQESILFAWEVYDFEKKVIHTEVLIKNLNTELCLVEANKRGSFSAKTITVLYINL